MFDQDGDGGADSSQLVVSLVSPNHVQIHVPMAVKKETALANRFVDGDVKYSPEAMQKTWKVRIASCLNPTDMLIANMDVTWIGFLFLLRQWRILQTKDFAKLSVSLTSPQRRSRAFWRLPRLCLLAIKVRSPPNRHKII